MVGEIYGIASHEIILMQGEAVLGLEAAARSLVRRGTPCLNLATGPFGKGFGYWLAGFGADLHEIEVPYDEVVTGDAVDAYLTAHPEIEVVSVVHSETPSGTLNPVWEIGPIARKHGAVTIVDCVSSWAGIELKPEEWQLDLLVAGPQKCLGGPPGMSLIAVSDRAWAVIEANPMAPRASFLSMLDWREKWHGDGAFPYTPSVSDLNGVHAACTELLDEGLDASIARHRRVFDAAWAGVEAMGLDTLAGLEGHRLGLRHRHPPARRPERRPGARPRPRALRRPALGRPGCRQPHPHRAPGRHGTADVRGRRPGRAGTGLRDLGATVDVGAGVDAAMASLSASAS